MGIAWGDYDNDSRTDLYVTNFIDDYNTLYRALEGGLYADVTRRTGLAQPAWLYMGWGTAMVDFDHDARLDIIVANGHVYPQVDTLKLPSGWRMPVQVFMNQGGRFGELPRAAVPGMAVGRGLAVGDFWNDGRIGVVINNLDGHPALYRPHAVEGRYIELALEGETIRDATGARVHIRWDGGGTTRLVVSGGSYLSSNDPRVHAGVGSATAVDVEITWPGGQRQTVQRLETNRLHRIRQASAEK
jgi:hypothetical protein